MPKSRIQKREIVYIGVIVLLLLYIAISTVSLPGIFPTKNNYKGYSKVSVNAKENAIILTSGCDALLMLTTTNQVNTIKKALKNLTTSRPLTHDVISDIIDNSTINIDSVRIEKLVKNTYYANIYLSNNVIIDSRPSDAIAIALRVNAPIFVNKTLMEKHGQNICGKEKIEKGPVEF